MQLYRKFLEKQNKAQREKMDKMEQEMEKEMGQIIVDASKTESLKLKKANTTFENNYAPEQSTKSTSKNSKPQGSLLGNSFGKGGMTALFKKRDLAQKKVEAQQVEGPGPKRSNIGPVATGMLKFMKHNSTTAAKPNVKAPPPMIFRKKKA